MKEVWFNELFAGALKAEASNILWHFLECPEATGKEMCHLPGAICSERNLSATVFTNKEQWCYFNPAFIVHGQRAVRVTHHFQNRG